jgi:hypothetical protein
MGSHSIQVPGGVDGNPNITFKVNSGAPAKNVIVFSYLLIVVYALTLAPVCWIYGMFSFQQRWTFQASGKPMIMK